MRSEKVVRRSKTDEIYIKIVYWGPAGGGKTTCLDTFAKLVTEEAKEVIPQGDITKIAMSSGSTLYFDRGIFRHTQQNKILFHVYTVAGQSRFSPLRKKIFDGTDGVIFVWDAQRARLEDNLESLRELKKISDNKLIKYIPLLVMLNKVDLNDTITKEELEGILREEGLLYPNDDPLSLWNPIVYPSVALYENQRNVYAVFSELARRTALYQVYGDGEAPVQKGKIKLSKKVPDV